MKRIASFEVDHRTLMPGMYISRIDGDITTYDMRTRKPNTGDLMDNSTMHSFEHMFATFIRNSEISDSVIYFGPMGCQTGFYLLIRNADNSQVLNTVKKLLLDISEYIGDMPGNSEIECGNFRSLNIEVAKKESVRYYNILKDKTIKDMIY